jgi:hypothetical protein
MLTTIDESQSSVFAQITPAPEKFGSTNDGESSNDSDTDTDTSNDDESAGSSGSSDDDDDSDLDASSNEEEEDDFEQTNPLLEQIRNNVFGALSASGIPMP